MDKRMNSPEQIIELGNLASSENLPQSSAANLGQIGVTGQERHQIIAKAAYLRAERRGFSPGSELEDWLAAEAEIDTVLAKSGAASQSKDA